MIELIGVLYVFLVPGLLGYRAFRLSGEKDTASYFAGCLVMLFTVFGLATLGWALGKLEVQSPFSFVIAFSLLTIWYYVLWLWGSGETVLSLFTKGKKVMIPEKKPNGKILNNVTLSNVFPLNTFLVPFCPA